MLYSRVKRHYITEVKREATAALQIDLFKISVYIQALQCM